MWPHSTQGNAKHLQLHMIYDSQTLPAANAQAEAQCLALAIVHKREACCEFTHHNERTAFQIHLRMQIELFHAASKQREDPQGAREEIEAFDSSSVASTRGVLLDTDTCSM